MSSATNGEGLRRLRLDRVNRWVTFGANVGVLVGLIILIVEVRQNASLTRTAMEQAKNEFFAEIELNISRAEMAEAWVKSIRAPESMTDAEIRMVEGVLVAVMLQFEHRFQMEEAGLSTRTEARQHVRNAAPYYFGSRFGKNWWKHQASAWVGTPMMEASAPIIDGLSEDFLATYLDSVRIGPPPP